jgi:hypothetical protein
VCRCAVRRFGLLETLGVSEAKFGAFVESLEGAYRSPDYHTAVRLALFTALFCSHNTAQLMTAMCTSNQSDTPGSDDPTRRCTRRT